MTDAEAKALGLRALEAGFQWAPGVKLGDADETYRLTFAWYIGDDDEGATPVLHPAGEGIGPGWGWPADGSGWWPDFRDPATLGVLVAQVRERSGDPHLFAEWAEWGVCDEGLTEGEWWCARLDEEGVAGPTEQAAWVAALETCAEA